MFGSTELSGGLDLANYCYANAGTIDYLLHQKSYLERALMRGYRRPWTSEEDDRLRKYVVAGWSRHAISVVLGRSDDYISAICN